MPQIEIPHLNPLNFVDSKRDLPLDYQMRHFDAWKSNEQILPFVQGKCYPQKWQRGDISFLQIQSNYDPVRIRVRNLETGVEVLQQIMNQVSLVNGKIWLQSQIAWDTPATPEGYYRVEIFDDIGNVYPCEDLDIREEHPGTILFKYWNVFNNDILWEERPYFLLRLDGVIVYDKPISQRVIYTDQPNNTSTVKGRPSRGLKLIVGNLRGIPDWQIDRLDEIMDQTNVEIDGKGFSAAEGAEFNRLRIPGYAYSQWDLDIRETNNRRSKIFTVGGFKENRTVTDYNVNLGLFGALEGEANDNSITINSIT